ncbi:MAG: hypothetical protein KY439_00790 [Actinobacteria bacterium]|nr:hypothetical protein [Actinomycetota bacterium]
MTEYEFWPAVVAGFLGGLVMSMVMKAMAKAGKTEMDLALIEGSMFTGDRKKAMGIGMVMHLVLLSGIVIGSIYALLFSVLDVDPSNLWWVGALFGIAHGAMAGALMMPALPLMHPRMVDEDSPLAGEIPTSARPGSPVLTAEPELRLRAPGLFGKYYGKTMPAMVIMVHLLYGLTVGLVYWWLAA